VAVILDTIGMVMSVLCALVTVAAVWLVLT
jgi:hypothetical protein